MSSKPGDEIFETSRAHVTKALDSIARRGRVSQEDALQLAEAGIGAPGFSIYEIIGRQLGISSLQSVANKVRNTLVKATELQDALDNYEQPEAVAGTPGLDEASLATLTARVRAAADILRERIAEHGDVTPAPQSVERHVEASDGGRAREGDGDADEDEAA